MSSHRTALKAELEAAGLFDHRPSAVYAKLVLLAGLTAGFFAAFFLVDAWLLRVPAFLAGVVTSIALVMIAHDSGHGAVSRNKVLNDLPGWLLFPFFAGLSLPYWRHKHNTLHHSYTNVVGKDPDVDIYPFAMNREQRAKGGFQKAVQSHQSLWFWPLTLFTTLAMRFDSFKWHLTVGRKVCSPKDRAIDLLCLAGHYTLWLVVPPVLLGASLATTVGFYLAWGVAAGVLLAAIFLPAHMTQPLVTRYDDNFLLQLQTTQNLKTNPLFSFLLIGLDHQVEHHLFQRMSHLNVKKASRIIRAYCARNGLPYHEQDWGAALVDCTLRMGRLPDEEGAPQPPLSVEPEPELRPAA